MTFEGILATLRMLCTLIKL